MANSAITLKDASGTSYTVDTETQTGGDHRQTMGIGDPGTTAVAPVDATFGLAVRTSGMPGPLTTGNITTTVSTAVSAAANGYGNATITLHGTYGAGLQIFFEGSDDSGTTWYSDTVQRETDNQVLASDTLTANQSVAYLMALPGWTNIRVRPAAVTASGTAIIRITPSGTLVVPTVSLGNVGASTSIVTRTTVNAANIQLIGANPNRRSLVIMNEGTVPMRYYLGSGTESATNYTGLLQANQSYEPQIPWYGVVKAGTASGSVVGQITEVLA